EGNPRARQAGCVDDPRLPVVGLPITETTRHHSRPAGGGEAGTEGVGLVFEGCRGRLYLRLRRQGAGRYGRVESEVDLTCGDPAAPGKGGGDAGRNHA